MDEARAAEEGRQPFRDARGAGTIVFDRNCLRQATPGLFEPASYGTAAVPVRGAGRGSAWFVHGEFGDAVLRHYRRGGWMARLSRDGYLWNGPSRVRSLVEFRMLSRLVREGLPVPAPIAASYRRSGPVYRAAILVRRVPAATTLLERVRADADTAPWSAVGAAIACCHRAGAHHADLNANNVLLDDDGKVWLIDWDKGRFEATAGAWCGAVLDRLQRSLRKDAPSQITAIDRGMVALRAAHAQGLVA